VFRVRIDPNMNITILRKPSNSHLLNSYSTYLMVRKADQSYAGRNNHYIIVPTANSSSILQ
jgi:hypothetical protein